jgi:hypothetical protein
VYVTVHVDYDLKQSYGYTKSSLDAMGGHTATLSGINVLNGSKYEFDYRWWLSGGSTWSGWSEPVVQNVNVFKNDPGIAGLVMRDDGTGILGVKVVISGGGVTNTVYTDEDGWYMWYYKYTGKPTTFRITLPAYNVWKEITVKSNSFSVVNFGGPTQALHLSLTMAGSSSSATGTLLAAIAAMIVSCILVGILVSSGARSFFTLKAPKTRTLRHSGRSLR